MLSLFECCPILDISDFKNILMLTIVQALSDAGITPDDEQTYDLSDIQDAAAAIHGGKTPYFDCSDGALSAVYYYFHISGNAINGNYTPVDSRKCVPFHSCKGISVDEMSL